MDPLDAGVLPDGVQPRFADGVMSRTWIVENTQIRLVSAPIAAECVIVSNDLP